MIPFATKQRLARLSPCAAHAAGFMAQDFGGPLSGGERVRGKNDAQRRVSTRRLFFAGGGGQHWRCVDIANDLMINDEIREREVRLIDEKGAQLGVMPTQQALALAEERGMDLVALQVNVRPVVCKLMDYDKYRYEQSRRERESRKNQRIVEVKEVQLSATIAENDVLTKAKAAIRFLENGDKVRVSIRFRGRQITHSEIGLKVMQDFAERCAEVSVIERRPILDGRNMIMILAPKAAKASFAEKKAAREKAATAQQEAQE